LNDTHSPNGVAAVERALSILLAFRGTNGKLSLKDIASKTGMYKSTVLRLIASLENQGFMRRVADGSYRLGAAVSELGNIYQSSFQLKEFVEPVLEDLVQAVNESASFYVASGGQRHCLFRVDANQVIRDHIKVGDTHPLGKGASGRCLLQFENGAPAVLKKENLVTTSLGERHPDMASVAAPIFQVGGDLVGALTLSGPRQRFTPETIATMKAVLIKEASELSKELGFDWKLV
jgi:DNA-binding IclR family transcriptional regulator